MKVWATGEQMLAVDLNGNFALNASAAASAASTAASAVSAAASALSAATTAQATATQALNTANAASVAAAAASAAVAALGTTSTSSGTGSGTGTVSGSLTVDLRVPTGQTVYNTIYGFGTGAVADSGFAATANTGVQAALRALTPTLVRVNTNANVSGAYWQDAVFAAGVGSPNWTYFDPLFDNAATWMTASTQILLGVGGANLNEAASSVAAKATALANRAIAKGRPIKLWELFNEADGGSGVIPSNYSATFNAVADALHAVDASNKLMGPVSSYVAGYPDGQLQGWANASGAKAGGVCMHMYGFKNWSTRDQLYASADQSSQLDSLRRSVAGTPAANVPAFNGEWNIVSDVSNPPEQANIAGGVYVALNTIRCLNVANAGLQWQALWELYLDGDYGVINSSNQIVPAGVVLAYAGQVMGGSRVSSSLTVSAPSIAQYATVSGGQFAVQLVNYSTSAALSGFTVGLTAPSSVSSTVTVWQLSPASLSPTPTTMPLTSLTGSGIVLPSESVTMITGRYT